MDLEYRTIILIKNIYKAYSEKCITLHAGNSGGKDSAVLDHLLQKSEISYNSYYCNTTIDPTGTIGYIRKNFPHTKILNPKESFYQLIKKKGLPTRLNRYCCQLLKEYGSIGKYVFEGIRAEESYKRKNRDIITCDDRRWQHGAQHIYPILHWKEKDIYNYIEKNSIELAPCYVFSGGNMNRLGCVGCPQVSKKGQREQEFKFYPKHLLSITRAINIGMQNNPQWKLTQLTNGDPELAIKWWLSGNTMTEYFKKIKQLKLEL